MKELSFFLLKNSFGSKMRKGFKNFCNNDASTSTLNQHCHIVDPSSSSCVVPESLDYLNSENRQPTLEEMILKLDLEEKMAKRAELDEYYGETQPQTHHRMSCVSSSDILRSARNALNQYPRFSLDGKDAMYRSSFRNLSARPGGGRRKVFDNKDGGNLVSDRTRLPAKVAGESVVWCKPGVVGKLMGLDAMPMPAVGIGRAGGGSGKDQRLMIKRQNLRKRTEREMINGGDCVGIKRGPSAKNNIGSYNNNNSNKGNKMMMATGVSSSCCSTKGRHCVMNNPPVAVLELRHDEAGWPMRRFL